MSIPLTEDEVNAICTVKDEQARMENLCGELRDLGEDDPCFEGHDLQELINDQKFLHAVMDGSLQWARRRSDREPAGGCHRDHP